MTLDDRFSELVRDALAPMLSEQLDHLEERLVERLAMVFQGQSALVNQPPALLTLDDVATHLKLAPRTVQRMVASGEFPSPIPVSSGRSRWRWSDIDAWLERQEGR